MNITFSQIIFPTVTLILGVIPILFEVDAAEIDPKIETAKTGNWFKRHAKNPTIVGSIILVLLAVTYYYTLNEISDTNNRLKYDSENFLAQKQQWVLDSTRFDTIKSSFMNVVNQGDNLLRNIKNFEEREFTKIDNSNLYLSFIIAFNYSGSNLGKYINAHKSDLSFRPDNFFYGKNIAYLQLPPNNELSFQGRQEKYAIEQILDEIKSGITLRFSKKGKSAKLSVNGFNPKVFNSFEIDKENNILFSFSTRLPMDRNEDLIKLNFTSGSQFGSYLDFENCKVKLDFGPTLYSRQKPNLLSLKMNIFSAKLILDIYGLDYIDLFSLKSSSNTVLQFSGTTNRLVIKSVENNFVD